MKGNVTLSHSIVLTRIFTLCLVLTSATLAVAQLSSSDSFGGNKVCSNRTLLGNYGFQIEGTILGPNLALRTLSMAHFEGHGKLTSVDHVVLDGVPPAEEWRPTTGTYSVNPDCTGAASIDVAPGNPPLGYHFLVVNDGRKILLVVDGGAIRGEAYRVD